MGCVRVSEESFMLVMIAEMASDELGRAGEEDICRDVNVLLACS